MFKIFNFFSFIYLNKIHRGSINFLAVDGLGRIVTASSDKTIKILDPTNSFKELVCLKTTESVVCGDIYESFLALGCADGNMLGYMILIVLTVYMVMAVLIKEA